MDRMMTWGAVAVLAVTAGTAGAQTKTVTGEMKTLTANVEAIDRSNREVTVKKSDGTYEVFYAPQEFKRFDTLKVGDSITARYYENIVLQLKRPDEKDVDTSSEGVTRSDRPTGTGGTAARQRTITARITAIDPAVPSVTFSGPNGWTYSTRVRDKKALSKVNVGDRVDITWTTAVILSLEQAR